MKELTKNGIDLLKDKTSNFKLGIKLELFIKLLIWVMSTSISISDAQD
jgi:hypothetical protein